MCISDPLHPPSLCFFYLNKGVDPQAKGQPLTWIKLHKRFEDFGVDPFAGFISTNIFPAKDSSYPNNVAGKFLTAVRFSGNKGGLTEVEESNVCFINIEANAERGVIGQSNDRRIKLSGDVFAGVAEFAENDAVKRRADEGLLEERASLSKLRFGEATAASARLRSSTRASASISEYS